MLQDALSEVIKIYPPLKLMVFVDDIPAPVKEVVAEMAKKVMKKLKEEFVKLSVTEKGKEGKSKMIASCGFLENELRQFSGEEGQTLGVDLRTKVKRLGAKEKSEKNEVQSGILAYQEEFNIPEELHEKWCQEVGMMPARTWGVHAVRMSPTGEVNIEEAHGGCCG